MSLYVAQVSLVFVILLVLFLKCLDYRLLPSDHSCLYDLICVLLCVHVHVFLYIKLPLCVPACERQKTSSGVISQVLSTIGRLIFLGQSPLVVYGT